MREQPLVSVILPCFNAERFLPDCIESLTRQTYRNLEFLALDDGSTDRTGDILRTWAERDQRVRLLPTPRNRGLIASLNRGVAAAKGEFIARMDADDTSSPYRFDRQLSFLHARPDIALVGSGIRLVDAQSGRLLTPRPVQCVTPIGIRFTALFATPLNHVTVFARSDVMRRHRYGLGLHSLHTEDYELWTRMLASGVRIANLEEPLVTVRANPAGVSRGSESLQIENFVASSRAHLERTTGIVPRPAAHRVLVNRIDDTVTAADFKDGLGILRNLEAQALADAPDAHDDIRRATAMQEQDIALQALLKGSWAVRREVVLSVPRLAPAFATRSGCRYVAGKLATRLLSMVRPQPSGH